MALQKDYSDVSGTERWFGPHYLLGAFLEIVDAGEKGWVWWGKAQEGHPLYCRRYTEYMPSGGGGKPFTVFILQERSKNPCCHAGVGFQVVTVDLVGGIAFHLMRGTGIDCRCSSTSTYVWGQ